MISETIFQDQNLSKGSSILNIDDFVNWKKQNKAYNFSKLPETAIITLFNKKREWFKAVKKLKGLNGKNYIVKTKSASNEVILCTGFGSGAPSVINLCEELRALGVKNFIFLGLGGSLVPDISEGELTYVKTVLSASGISYYYCKDEKISPFNSNYSNKMAQQLKAKPITVLSTDAPFRETNFVINHFKEKGAEMVEMECAGLYAFSNFHQVNIACFIISSDQLSQEWTPPKQVGKLFTLGQKTIDRLINYL